MRILPAVVLLAGLVAGCAGRGAPPTAGWERGTAPELAGTSVLLLPLQALPEDEEPDLRSVMDQELEYALREREPGARWVGVEELGTALDGAGEMGVDPASLSTQVFARGQVRQVGDPLFGELYRLAAMADARFLVLPISLRRDPETGGPGTDGDHGRVAMVLDAAVLDARTGRVLWRGLVAGDPAEPGSPLAPASVADRLARRLVP